MNYSYLSQRTADDNLFQWIRSNPEHEEGLPTYVYPDEDLIPRLIEAYFEQINLFLPLLHRPTFEKSVADGLHIKDPMFGATLLLVCAHGSRYSDDPRVLAEGSDSPRSAGWKWFEQVNVLRKSLFKRTTLYELQMHAVRGSVVSSFLVLFFKLPLWLVLLALCSICPIKRDTTRSLGSDWTCSAVITGGWCTSET